MKHTGDGQYEILYTPIFSSELYPNAIAEYRKATVCTLCASEIMNEDTENVREEVQAMNYYRKRASDGRA